jgi:hypothetical protein
LKIIPIHEIFRDIKDEFNFNASAIETMPLNGTSWMIVGHNLEMLRIVKCVLDTENFSSKFKKN